MSVSRLAYLQHTAGLLIESLDRYKATAQLPPVIGVEIDNRVKALEYALRLSKGENGE